MAMTRTDMSVEENYQKLLGNNADGTRNPDYEVMLDVENFIDYYICNIYVGSNDWDHHNWYAIRRKTNSEGFKFSSKEKAEKDANKINPKNIFFIKFSCNFKYDFELLAIMISR